MKQKTILITGATGFLGSSITQELFEAGFRLKLLVRKTHDLQAKERFPEIFPLCYPSLFADRTRVDRIEIIEGDVSKKYLGLDTREYIRLAKIIDEVFHCAASIKFNDAHNTLTQTNVSGTENVVQFCYTEKIKRLHYISTAYVAGKRRDVVYEDELDKGQAFNNNYEKSKFDAEKILGQFARQYDVPTTVYRPSIIVGNSRTGYTKNYDNIYIFGKGLYYLKNYKTRNSSPPPALPPPPFSPSVRGTGGGRQGNNVHSPPLVGGGELLPKHKSLMRTTSQLSQNAYINPSYLRIPGDKYGAINLIPVDYAARTIVAISRRDESINETFHIVNPSPPTLGELAEWMAVATGNRIRILRFHELQAQPYTMFEKLFLLGTEAFQPYLFGESYFDSTNTKRLLRGTGIECPLITQELINRFIQYGVDTHWGKKNTTSGKEDRFYKYKSRFSLYQFEEEKQMKERPEIPGNVTHSEYFNKLLKARVNLSPIPKISSLNAVLQFEITDNGNGTWNVIVENGLVTDVTAELCVSPTCIFKLNSDTFLSIIKREITPQQAFFRGMVDIKGDMVLALKMNILVAYM